MRQLTMKGACGMPLEFVATWADSAADGDDADAMMCVVVVQWGRTEHEKKTQKNLKNMLDHQFTQVRACRAVDRYARPDYLYLCSSLCPNRSAQ